MKPFENFPDGPGNDRPRAVDALISIAIGLAILLAIALQTTQAWAQLPAAQSTAVSVDTNGVIIFPTDISAFFASNGIPSLGTLTNALGTTATPTYGAAAGTYLNSVGVVLSCATPNATIVYTTDGSTPSATNGVTYTNSFTLSSTATVKAYARSYYRPDSSVASRSYTITGGTRVYYGRSSNTTLTGTQVEALGYTTHTSGINGNYTFASGSGYYYFAWVQSFDSPTALTGFTISGVPVSMADSSVSYSGSLDNGWTYQTASNGGNTYKVYRSAYPLGGANTVVLSGDNAAP